MGFPYAGILILKPMPVQTQSSRKIAPLTTATIATPWVGTDKNGGSFFIA